MNVYTFEAIQNKWLPCIKLNKLYEKTLTKKQKKKLIRRDELNSIGSKHHITKLRKVKTSQLIKSCHFVSKHRYIITVNN